MCARCAAILRTGERGKIKKKNNKTGKYWIPTTKSIMHGRNICTELLDNGASTPQFWKEELETEATFSSFLFQENAEEEARRHSIAQRTEAQSDRNVGAVRNFIHCFLSFRSPIAGKTNRASELGPPSNPITSREPRTEIPRHTKSEQRRNLLPSSILSFPPNKHDARKDDKDGKDAKTRSA